jgi:hypothetical protein
MPDNLVFIAVYMLVSRRTISALLPLPYDTDHTLNHRHSLLQLVARNPQRSQLHSGRRQFWNLILAQPGWPNEPGAEYHQLCLPLISTFLC